MRARPCAAAGAALRQRMCYDALAQPVFTSVVAGCVPFDNLRLAPVAHGSRGFFIQAGRLALPLRTIKSPDRMAGIDCRSGPSPYGSHTVL